jgi:starch-binding outer membrane protein, SusD/RagB family
MKKAKYYRLLVLIILLNMSCKKFVQISPPKNQLVDSEVFSDSTNATAAVLGLYINMLPNFTAQISNGGLSIYGGLSSDELIPTSNNTEENEFYNNNIGTPNSLNSGLWRIAYSIIYYSNACIDGIEKSKTLSASTKNELIGESKLVRAFMYFNLVNLYGNVPLITGTDYNINKNLERTPADSIFKFITGDLLQVKNYLPASYITSGRSRPNQHTANALLAKIFLYQKDWSDAEKFASQVINSGIYSLEPDVNNIYKSNSNEAIWKLPSIFPGIETWEGNFFIPTSTTRIPKYVISNYLLAAFEVGDQRKTKWLNSNTVAGQIYYYPYKYKVRTAGPVPQENFVVFRLGEQYLIRAEARANKNDLAAAVADLNIVRNRASLAGLPNTLDQTQVLSAIEQERRIELLCEWGNRWFDLKRTNKVETTLNAVKGNNWQPTDILYPIPQFDLNNNPFLVQNPGY